MPPKKKKKQIKGFRRVSMHNKKSGAKELAKAIKEDGRKYRIIKEGKKYTVFEGSSGSRKRRK